VWVSEHHFTDGGYNPSVTSLLAALAAAMEEIHLGSNVALGPMYKQPVRLAEDLAVIDNIADGRLTFGVANGYRVEEAGKAREDQTYVLWNRGFLHDEKDPEEVVGKHWQQFKDQYGDWYCEAGQIEDPRALHDAYDANAMFYSDPDEMVEKIEEYKDLFGDDMHFIYQAAFPSLDYEDFRYSIELFGQEVIPQVT